MPVLQLLTPVRQVRADVGIGEGAAGCRPVAAAEGQQDALAVVPLVAPPVRAAHYRETRSSGTMSTRR